MPRLSVVIPAYNEATRIGATLHALAAATAGQDVEVVVVDDGSTDDTAAVAESLLDFSGHRQVLRLDHNRGKGAAVRAGVLAARGEVILYMDADLATDLEALPRFLDDLRDADVVVGSRAVPGAAVKQGTRDRAVMGRVFNRLSRWSTGVHIHDTQCGFKALRGPAARTIFGLARCDRFAFDVEVLVLAERLGLRVVERPVTWTAVDGSSVRRVSDSARAAYDVVRIAWRWTPRRVRRARDTAVVRRT
ncbi:MAG TPA: glycosyltransferase [Acidimicrobiia bacterium]|nr:glycosyltransferase [Acidimicrobiia bacterium]